MKISSCVASATLYGAQNLQLKQPTPELPLRFSGLPPTCAETGEKKGEETKAGSLPPATEDGKKKPSSRKLIWASLAFNVLSGISLMISAAAGYFCPPENKPNASAPAAISSSKGLDKEPKISLPTTEQIKKPMQVEALSHQEASPEALLDAGQIEETLQAVLKTPGLNLRPQETERLQQELKSMQAVNLTSEQHRAFEIAITKIDAKDLTPERLVDTLKTVLKPNQFKALENNLSNTSVIVPSEKGHKLVKIRDFFHDAGWFLISMNLFFGCYNGYVFSYKNKQPSMVASTTISLVFSLVQGLISSSMPVRATIGMGTGLWLWGWSNSMKNDYNQKKGRPRGREFDMKPLVSRSELKRLTGPDAGNAKMAAEWAKQFGKMSWFTVTDPVLFVTDSVRGVSRHFRKEEGILKTVKEDIAITGVALGDLKNYILRRKKELPAVLEPYTQNRLAAIIALACNPPMVLYGNDPAFVDKMMKIGVLLGLPGKLTLLFIALEDTARKNTMAKVKDWWMRAGVFISIPLDRYGQHDWSIGTGKLTLGVPIQLYQNFEILKKDKEEQTQQALQASPEPDAATLKPLEGSLQMKPAETVSPDNSKNKVA